MTNVAGHLREQNGMYQMILSWKDTDGKRRTKSISTGLPVKGNKKRAESLLRKTQKEFNPETMQQVSDLPVSEYLNRWLRESVMNLPPETYGRYAYDLGRVVVPYFEKKRLSLKALSPRDLETFFRYERQQEEASVQQLLDWHKELTDALQYAVDNNWLKVSPIKEVDPCLDNSPVLFTDFITDWLKMMKSRVEITTYTSYERAIVHKIVPYFEPLHYTLQDMEQHPKYIQDFYQHELDRGLTANTVIHYHANIRKCLQYAFQIGMIRSNPADRVERPRKEKFKSEIYSGEELEQLFKAIQGDPSEFGVIMAAFYGLRRSEVVGLKWDAIDFENKKISIQHTVVTAKVNGTLTEIARDKTKTKSSCRTLPLIPACEQLFKTSMGYPFSIERDLIYAAGENDWNSVEKIIDEIFDIYISKTFYEKSLREMNIISLINTINRSIQKASLSINDLLSHNQYLFLELKMSSTSQELCNRIKDIYRIILAKGEKNQSLRTEDFGQQLKQYIVENYSRDISLNDIADHFSLSPNYMSLVFKKTLDSTFKEYLNRFRCEKAKELLRQPDIRVAEVSAMVGITNVNTFIRIFKKDCGISPGQYQAQLKK